MVENPNASKTRAKRKYNGSHYDQIIVFLPKGDKARIKEHAASLGVSVNAFITEQIFKGMKGDAD